MVKLQYLHWRRRSDILSKRNFPVVLNAFYLVSMLAVRNVTAYCHCDRRVKAKKTTFLRTEMWQKWESI